MTIYPLNFVNRRGIPLIETSSITVNDDNVVFTLPDRAFRFLNDKGILLFRLNQVIPTGTTDTLPVLMSVNDFTQPITNVGGEAITVAQMANAGVYCLYYDKDANLMQLLTT